ncbi:MAG: class I SAM-dependent methyltransferase [Actinomycetota bacterium]
MDPERHWERVYETKSPDEVSWYRPHLERSLFFIIDAKLGPDAPIIDVGGGSSTLVDDLLDLGHREVTVLDISHTAIDRAKERLGERAGQVTWIVGDVTSVELPPAHYEFWHDRAVFHFLTEPEARQSYVAAVHRSLKVDGHIVVATFGEEGPEKCSGLDVARYSADGLHDQFGAGFKKVSSRTENHMTPWGTEQEFVYCYCRLER